VEGSTNLISFFGGNGGTSGKKKTVSELKNGEGGEEQPLLKVSRKSRYEVPSSERGD